MRAKYGNVPTESDGAVFPSKKEARRYQELKLLERAGEIEHLVRQPQFELQPAFTDHDGQSVQAITYKPDFGYQMPLTGEIVVEEVKGGKATMTEASRLRIKLFKFKFRDIRFVLMSD